MNSIRTLSNSSQRGRMLPKISVILIILFSMLALACSSGDEAETPTGIRGSVMDDQGNSYPNVGLSLQPGNISATTDDTGDYSFNNLSPGDYQITINPPKSSEITTGNVSSVTLTAGQSQTVDFTLRLIPVDASLVLDLNDPLGQVRSSVSAIPTDPDELVFRRHTSGLIPINAPDGHQLTLQEWSAAGGTSSINCNGTTTNYQLSLHGLIPNGTYTLWNNIYSSTQSPGSALGVEVAGGALGASDGSENGFIASATGSATLSIIVGGGDALGFGGNQPDCALTDARGIILVVLYHLDHQTWGPVPGPDDTWVDHLLFYY